MDLGALDVVATSETGIDVVIVNPKTGEATDFVIRVKGIYSKQFGELISKAARKLGKQGDSSNDTDVMAKVLTQVTLGWKGLTDKGAEVPFSAEAAERVYANPLIRKQVWEAATNEGNLIPG